MDAFNDNHGIVPAALKGCATPDASTLTTTVIA